MSRHKFRVWDKEKKEMIDNVVPFFNSDGALECLVFGYSFGGYDFVEVELDRYEHIFTDPEFDERFVLMQYTCLKDRNGVEIYEGDIIQYFRNELAEIIFQNGGVDIRGLSSMEREPLQSRLGFMKVLGNIYENTELLECE